MRYDLDIGTNQYEEQVVLSSIAYENGKLTYRYVNCYSASSLGLGNCRCVNHDAVEEVEGEEAFLRISQLLENQSEYIRNLMARIETLEGGSNDPVLDLEEEEENNG